MDKQDGTTRFKSIKQESASEQVFIQLKKLIDTQVWKPGYRIPSENQLAEQFGVSRMTIRSATQKLKNFGLLDVCQGNGSFVRSTTIESYIFGQNSTEIMPNALTDAFELRFFLEQAAVELAIKNATEEDIATLKEILDKLIEATENNTENFRKFDIDFHRYIYVMSHNQLLLTIFNMMEPLLCAQIDKFDSSVPNHDELKSGRKNFHTLLFEKIAARDYAGCIKHLEWYREVIEKCMY